MLSPGVFHIEHGRLEGSVPSDDPSAEEPDRSVTDEEQSLADRQSALSDGEQALSDGQQALSDGQQALSDGKRALSDGQRSLSDREESISDEQSLSDREERFDPAQALSERDQLLSEADQTGSDLDQTSSDADQTASDRDQNASDSDQHAADLDQAASDQAHERGVDPSNYVRTKRSRSKAALERDVGTHARAGVARVRDETAERRDRDAEARDAAAVARDKLAATLDAEIEELERSKAQGGNGHGLGLEILLRASRDRKRAAASRARAAAQRENAARDRELARRDRAQAAGDRRKAADELAAEGVDHLTGTLRRRVGLAAIQREIERTRRTHDPLVVAFIDVNGLKIINDTHGHAAGDELLAGIAGCIKTALRPYDVVMRFGGDEFLCLLSGEGLHGVRDRFDQISEQIAKTQNGASIAVGLVEGNREESLEDLIVRADNAMLATRDGR